MVPRALPWALDLLGFQPAQGRQTGFFTHNLLSLDFLILNPPPSMGNTVANH